MRASGPHEVHTPPCPVETPVSRFPPAGILCTSCWGRCLRAVDFLGSLKRSVRSGRWSGQRPGHGSVRSGQWSGESLLSLTNGSQSQFGMAKGGQSLFGQASTHLLVKSSFSYGNLRLIQIFNFEI